MEASNNQVSKNSVMNSVAESLNRKSSSDNGAEESDKEQGALSYIKNLIHSQQNKKDKNDRSRFLGEGVSYKAKLIGILEVSEARGDRMCQEALADLKMAIRAAGEHKQRININIAIDGLRLRDEKTGDCLYHHPVHKISFIAQDMTDSRAFGYIFGSPDTGHRFFGIKTDKAASQVVISMRDLFQVVFELKKKEIEMAKQHIEQHQMKFSSPFSLNSHLSASNSASNGSSSTPKASVEPIKMLSLSDDRRKEEPAGDISQKKVVDLLLDLELELSNIHQGISQMIKITPCDPMGSTTSIKMDQFEDSFNNLTQKAKLPPPPDSIKRLKNENQWFDQETEVLFEDSEVSSTLPIPNTPDSASKSNSATSASIPSTSTAINTTTCEELISKRVESPKDSFDVFTDLDPLGTGRSRPYVDKKDFFQDLKNPPKKLLKDLVNEVPNEKSSSFKSTFPSTAEATNKQEVDSDSTFLVKPINSRKFSDPFQDDPFDKDPFVDEFTQDVTFKSYATDDPFEKFADFTSFDNKESSLTISPSINKTKLVDEKHSPLKVSLPPEKISSTDSSVTSPLQSRKLSRLQKQNTICGTVTLPSPKQKSRKVISQISVDAFSENATASSSSHNSLNLDQISNEVSAPEPPPRVNFNSVTGKPPPLPPKKLISTSSKPVPRAPNSDYDYIENYQSTAYSDFAGPPLPAPARKTKNGHKLSEPEYYLQPFPLLPPPKKKVSPKSSEPSESVNSTATPCPAKSLDITLSQLTKTGFSDLAASLNMSPSSLSKMTLQDLTKCLASFSNENLKKEKEVTSNIDPVTQIESTSNTFVENCDSEISFSAEFEAHFGGSSFSNAPCSEESLFDKYAVFRELVEQEQKLSLSSHDTGSEPTLKHTSTNSVNELNIENKVSPKESEITIPTEDRYAALRDLCLDDNAQENEIDGSDKDSIVEASRLDEDTDLFPSHLEEDTDLLPSHPHSESTESPTVTMKEHQSVMETTIMEEDVSALDGDDDEVPEEANDIIPVENENESVDKVSESKPDLSKNYESSSILPEVGVLESKVNVNSEAGPNIAWAKFESNETVSEKSQETQNEGHVSPWSADSKDNDLSPTIEDKKKYCRPRRRIRDEDESEEHWNMRMEPRSWSPSWRENGWSDGDSLCDEVPPYVRDYNCDWRGCRRRVSPWNSRDQSPWDEDERDLSEDQWEDCRWQGEPRQRPRYKGPSWEDERRRHYEEVRKSRKPMTWSSDIDRKSSRESLTWEDDDRYSKRSYVERRHRKWEDEVQGRHRRWRDRERVEPGKKMSVRYYRDRSHDHQWDDDYLEQGEVEQTHWPQRPRSCDRSRRQYSGHHPNEDFSDRRYPRTMNRDEYSADIDYRRRAQTLQLQKSRRKHNVTSSPFEDDFNSHFGYSNEINFAGSSSDVFEGDMKPPPIAIDSRKKYQFPDCSKQKDYSQFGSPHTPGSVHSRDDEISLTSNNRCCQQSPFEDDFISPDTRRCSGRSISSDMSDPKSGDDMFYSESKETYRIKCDNRRTRISNKSDPGTSSSWQSNKPITPSTEYAQTDNCRKKNNISDREVDPSEFTQQYSIEKKVNISDYKSILPVLKRSDSTSSLKKSESINIFARNRDPFDDDFFCESTSKPPGIEKGKSNFVDTSKWNDAFNSFNFADESK